MSTPACIGLHELFDSTDVRGHQNARRMCREVCPVFDWCAERTERLHSASHVVRPLTGTWAGRLFGRPKIGRRLVA